MEWKDFSGSLRVKAFWLRAWSVAWVAAVLAGVAIGVLTALAGAVHWAVEKKVPGAFAVANVDPWAAGLGFKDWAIVALTLFGLCAAIVAAYRIGEVSASEEGEEHAMQAIEILSVGVDGLAIDATEIIDSYAEDFARGVRAEDIAMMASTISDRPRTGRSINSDTIRDGDALISAMTFEDLLESERRTSGEFTTTVHKLTDKGRRFAKAVRRIEHERRAE